MAPAYRVTLEGYKDRHDHIEFLVCVTHRDGRSWRVWRRFSDFQSLHKQLSVTSAGRSPLPHPPEKTWLPSYVHFCFPGLLAQDDTFCRQRLRELQGYLDCLMANVTLAKLAPVKHMLGIGDPNAIFAAEEVRLPNRLADLEGVRTNEWVARTLAQPTLGGWTGPVAAVAPSNVAPIHMYHSPTPAAVVSSAPRRITPEAAQIQLPLTALTETSDARWHVGPNPFLSAGGEAHPPLPHSRRNQWAAALQPLPVTGSPGGISNELSGPLRCGEAPAAPTEDVVTNSNGEDSNVDGNCCAVCLNAPRTHAFVPCGHRCACEECGPNVVRRNARCPLCRVPAVAIMRIYT